MNRIVPCVLPCLAVLSWTLPSPVLAGIVQSPVRTQDPAELSGVPIAGSFTGTGLTEARHAGSLFVVSMAAGVTLFIAASIFMAVQFAPRRPDDDTPEPRERDRHDRPRGSP